MRAFRHLSGLLAATVLLGLFGVVGLLGASAAQAAAATSLRISAPASVSPGATATLHVRLLTAEGPVANRSVLLQRKDPSGWVQVGSVTTRSDGLASKALIVRASSRFRAHFRGDSVYATSTSRELVVASSTLGDRAAAEARRHYGKAYLYGAEGPTRFDCSGFTRYVFSRFGRSLPHNSGAQQDATRPIADSAKRPGDLIFTSRNGRVTHVGLYARGTSMWSPVQSGDHVRLQSFSGRTYTVGRVG